MKSALDEKDIHEPSLCDKGLGAATVFSAMVFTIPWESMITLPPFGGIGRIVGYLTMGLAAVFILLTGHFRHPTRWFLLPILLVGYMLISLTWVDSLHVLTTALVRLGTYLRLLIMAFMLYFLGESTRGRQRFLIAYLLGNWLLIALTILSYLFAHTPMSERIFAPGVNPNGMAFQLAFGIPMAAWLAHKKVGVPLIWWVYIPAAAVFTALTASRGGVLAGAAGLLILPLMVQRAHVGKKILLWLFLATVVGVSYHALPQASMERLASIERELSDRGTIGQRRGIWRAGRDAFWAAPVLGHGVGQFQVVAPRLGSKSGSSHNAFLSFAVELGMVGMGIFILMLVGLLALIWRLPFAERNLCMVMFLVWVIHSLSSDTSYVKATWFLFGLIPAFSATEEGKNAKECESGNIFA